MTEFSTNFKRIPWRSPKMLAAAKGMSCTICGRNDGSTVAAHSNDRDHGRGLGWKADDCFIADLCIWCHNGYDRRDCTPGQWISQEQFDHAMHKTWKRRLEQGVLK
jgi:hypothetical protein